MTLHDATLTDLERLELQSVERTVTFEMDEEGILQYTEGFPAGELEYIEDAMDVCPVQAIFLKGDQ